ncbi:MAG: hypothetical protein IPG50_27995 [Myxococcales bacterium]|nr:hypothetical protein [Myxococcales bacterium]
MISLAQACSSDDPAPATPGADAGGDAEGDAVVTADASPNKTPLAFVEAKPGVLSAKVKVNAASGASLELPAGAVFDIPPGALAQDTELSIEVPKDQTRASRFQSFRFEPTATVFSTPATLHVPYDPIDGQQPTIRGWSSGDFNPMRGARSELTDREPMTVTARDSSANKISFEVKHFTFFNVFIQIDELLYLIPHIPARNLRPGDMLFVLTSADNDKGPHWNPGHVGIFGGGGTPCVGGTKDEVYESTTVSQEEIKSAIKRRDDARKKGLPEQPIPQSGVRKASLPGFKTDSGHFYLGARRPGEGNPLSPAERTSVVDFCKQQVGKGYNIIGQGNINESSWSCVGLAEAAHDLIGRGSMGDVREAFGGTPIELYWNTKPVEEVTVGAGETFEMIVAATTVHPASFFPTLNPGSTFVTEGWYCDGFPCGTGAEKPTIDITIESGKPLNAALNKFGFRKQFVYFPDSSEVGKTYDVVFKLTANVVADGIFGTTSWGTRTATKTVRINVVPCASPETPPGCYLPTDPPEQRTACLVGGAKAKTMATTSTVPVTERGLHGSSDPTIPPSPVFGGVDIIAMTYGLFVMDAAEHQKAFGNTIFPCGDGVFGRTFCGTNAASTGAGDWLYASAIFGDEISLSDPNYHFQYAFVFDQDDNTSNNYPATPPYTADFFAGTDRWYEVGYTPAGGWQFKTRNANATSQITAFASAARFILAGNIMTLAVPKSEFASATPKMRATAFRHRGDYGLKPPYEYIADTHPAVGQPLLVVGN